MTDRPLDPRDALAWAVHRRMYPDHVLATCDCPDWVKQQDLAEAEVLLELLDGLGGHLAYDLALPEHAPAGKRETSRKAAANIADLKGGQLGVFELIKCHGAHGLTDFELARQYPGFAEANGYPRLAPESPRKRRQSLTDVGHLVDSGRTRVNPDTGNECVVWVAEVAVQGERAA